MNLSSIKLIISEVDGIITEGLVGMGEMDVTIFKQFCTKDFEAINLIKKMDYSFVFMSADAAINMSMCRKRNIAFFQAERSKKDVYHRILEKYSVSANEVLYVGHTYSDIECVRMSAVSMCPEDSVNSVKNAVDYVIPVYGGAGVLSYVYEMLLKASRSCLEE